MFSAGQRKILYLTHNDANDHFKPVSHILMKNTGIYMCTGNQLWNEIL